MCVAVFNALCDRFAIGYLRCTDINLNAVLVAPSWRHVGYGMMLCLAGLKGFDPTLREAAQIDGANERQTFFHMIFPVLRPINIVVVDNETTVGDDVTFDGEGITLKAVTADGETNEFRSWGIAAAGRAWPGR